MGGLRDGERGRSIIPAPSEDPAPWLPLPDLAGFRRGKSIFWPMIIGIGIDMVQIERIRAASPRLFERVCTERERAFCEKFGEGRFERYAGRFAIKEAVSKALGTGIAEGVRWTDIEALPNEKGAPVVTLSGVALEKMRAMGAARVHASLSHDKVQAVAVAILESDAA